MKIHYNREEVGRILSVWAHRQSEGIDPSLDNSHWELEMLGKHGARLRRVADDEERTSAKATIKELFDPDTESED